MPDFISRYAWVIALVIAVAGAAFGFFMPRVGALLSTALVSLAVVLLVSAYVVGHNASMESSRGWNALAMVIIGGLLVLLAVIVGFASWLGW